MGLAGSTATLLPAIADPTFLAEVGLPDSGLAVSGLFVEGEGFIRLALPDYFYGVVIYFNSSSSFFLRARDVFNFEAVD